MRYALIAVAGVAICVACLVDLRGDFPLNDDWLYARVVEEFLATGRIAKPQLAAASLVGQSLWGAATSVVLGFSHTSLRVAGFALHLVASLCTALAVGARAGSRKAAFAGLLVLLSPLGLVSACSFMPEPALEAAVAGTVLMLGVWEERPTVARGGALALASAFAFLVHPVGLLVPVWCLARALFAAPVGRGSRSRWRDLAPPLVALGAAIPFLAWYLHGTEGTMSGMWLDKSRGIEVPLRLLTRPGILPSLGLLLLPCGLAWVSPSRTFAPTCVILWVWGQAWWLGSGTPLPLPSLENVLHRGGLGFVGLQGTPPALPPWFWMVASLASAGSAIGLIGALMGSEGLPPWVAVATAAVPWVAGVLMGQSILRAIAVGLTCAALWAWTLRGTLRALGPSTLALVWLGVLAAAPPFYDRYLVPLVPLFVVDLVPRLGRLRAWAWGVLAALGVLSAAGTHDYLAWNRCRWELVEGLLADGVSPDEIEAGYEWAGWRHAWRGTVSLPRRDPASPWWIRLWAPQIVPRYVVALCPLPGYETVGEVPCATLGRGWRIFVLRRGSPAQDLTATQPQNLPWHSGPGAPAGASPFPPPARGSRAPRAGPPTPVTGQPGPGG